MKNNSHLFRSRAVILNMLQRRGYDISQYDHYTLDDINAMMNIVSNGKVTQKFPVTPFDIKIKHLKDDKYMHIRYIFGSKLKIANIETILMSMEEEEKFHSENDEVIFITDYKVPNESMFDNQLDGLYKKLENKYYSQVFEISKLIINIMDHEFVPEHTIIPNEDKSKLLERFDIASYSQLPIILKSDPVAKFIGMKRGDICKIIRPSETSGKYEMYRYCQ